MIRVESVTKRAGSIEILRGVDLCVERGEVVGVLGPSGAGKTTLLNLIAGVDRPSSGRIAVGGVRLAELGPRELALFRRDTVGFVFQNYHLLPNLTVLQNVAVPLLLKGAGAREAARRAAECLQCVALDRRAKHLPEQLSGGERQRTAIARAIAGGPSLLLADEPTGSLDSEAGARILDLLRELQRRFSTTMVIVTHDSAVAACCNRILHLRDGRIA